jgi:D-sedoheptulose 7-phosphate isomerase
MIITRSLMPVVILCGGRGTRLGSLTQHIPKSLVSIAGHPFLWHQLQLLKRNGVKRAILLVGHLGEQIQEVFKDGSELEIQIDYSFDGPTLLGTAGSIYKALPLLPEQFFVLYGDSYLDCDYRAVQKAFERSGHLALMTTYNGTDYGLGAFRRSVFEMLLGGSIDLAVVYQELLRDNKLSILHMDQRFYEIGSREGLREVESLLKNNVIRSFLSDIAEIAQQLDTEAIGRMVSALVGVRGRGGRLFILGVGGSAANASHAVNDFRKLCGIEAYSPTDNVAELTARVNDDGWPTVFSPWLRNSHLQPRDAILILSVGGGSVEKNVSPNIVTALDYAKEVGATILGIVGRDGGYTAQVANVCVLIPTVNPERVTPYTEAFQAVIWHLLVFHPSLQQNTATWEGIV